jgi:hypothetical protein
MTSVSDRVLALGNTVARHELYDATGEWHEQLAENCACTIYFVCYMFYCYMYFKFALSFYMFAIIF